jgi:hypothetical protein
LHAKKRALLAGCKRDKAIVFDVGRPEEGPQHCAHPRELARKPTRQIDQMGALTEQFSAGEKLRGEVAIPFRNCLWRIVSREARKLLTEKMTVALQSALIAFLNRPRRSTGD